MDSVFAVYSTEERIMKINREKIPGGIPEDFLPDSDLLKSKVCRNSQAVRNPES